MQDWQLCMHAGMEIENVAFFIFIYRLTLSLWAAEQLIGKFRVIFFLRPPNHLNESALHKNQHSKMSCKYKNAGVFLYEIPLNNLTI